jgi:hypothetical protein
VIHNDPAPGPLARQLQGRQRGEKKDLVLFLAQFVAAQLDSGKSRPVRQAHQEAQVALCYLCQAHKDHLILGHRKEFAQGALHLLPAQVGPVLEGENDLYLFPGAFGGQFGQQQGKQRILGPPRLHLGDQKPELLCALTVGEQIARERFRFGMGKEPIVSAQFKCQRFEFLEVKIEFQELVHCGSFVWFQHPPLRCSFRSRQSGPLLSPPSPATFVCAFNWLRLDTFIVPHLFVLGTLV